MGLLTLRVLHTWMLVIDDTTVVLCWEVICLYIMELEILTCDVVLGMY